jgi:hypothetical protein
MASPSTAPASSAAPAATPIEKLLVLDEVISHRFGMAISSYPRALIERHTVAEHVAFADKYLHKL